MGASNKLIPAATEEDQEGIVRRELGEPIVLGTPAFSSPDPETEKGRMLPVTDDVTAAGAAEGENGDGGPKEGTAAWFIAKVEAAEDQDALDAVAEEYSESGKEYSSVVAAIEKRQDEINAQS